MGLFAGLVLDIVASLAASLIDRAIQRGKYRIDYPGLEQEAAHITRIVRADLDAEIAEQVAHAVAEELAVVLRRDPSVRVLRDGFEIAGLKRSVLPGRGQTAETQAEERLRRMEEIVAARRAEISKLAATSATSLADGQLDPAASAVQSPQPIVDVIWEQGDTQTLTPAEERLRLMEQRVRERRGD